MTWGRVPHGGLDSAAALSEVDTVRYPVWTDAP